MVGKKFSAFVVIISVLLYVFYTPLPDGAVEPWLQLMMRTICRIGHISANVAVIFGYDRSNFIRMLSDGNFDILFDDNINTTDTKFNGVDVRIYQPRTTSKNDNPGLIFMHGGGWEFGSIAFYDKLMKKISNLTGFVSVSVGYRRSPENPFPIPFDDCLTATTYFIRNAKQFGVDPLRVGIVGDSFGGNLAAAITIQLSKKENTENKPRSQTLIYPPLQALNFELPSYRKYNDETGPFLLSKLAMVRCWLHYGAGNLQFLPEFLLNSHITTDIKNSIYFRYINISNLPEKYTSEFQDGIMSLSSNETVFKSVSKWILDPYVAPLMSSDEDLKTLPPTHLITVEYDPLRDDGFLFASRLRGLNKEILHTHYDGLGHGFISYDFLDSSDIAVEEMVQFWNGLMFEEEELLKRFK